MRYLHLVPLIYSLLLFNIIACSPCKRRTCFCMYQAGKITMVCCSLKQNSTEKEPTNMTPIPYLISQFLHSIPPPDSTICAFVSSAREDMIGI